MIGTLNDWNTFSAYASNLDKQVYTYTTFNMWNQYVAIANTKINKGVIQVSRWVTSKNCGLFHEKGGNMLQYIHWFSRYNTRPFQK